MKRSPMPPRRTPLRARPDSKMRAFSMLVLRRDPFCQYPACDRRSEHAHHPYQRSTHPSLRYRWDLGVGVCGPHHRQIHAHPEASYALGLLKRSWEMPDEERSAAADTSANGSVRPVAADADEGGDAA